MNTPQQALSKEISDLRVQTLLQTVSDQRNSALNEVANIKGEIAVLTRLLNDQIAVNNELKENQQKLIERLQVVATNVPPTSGFGEEDPAMPKTAIELASPDAS